jgi:hypothetical protein
MQNWPTRNWTIMHSSVEAGIVEKPEDYLYISVRNYHEIKGLTGMIVVGTDIQVTALAQAASRRKMHFVNLLAGQLKLAPEPGTLLNTM